MALKITLKNSATPNKRPSPALIGFGEVTVNYDSVTGGIFYKNNAGGITKVGPCQVSATPPNAAPAGFAGNGIGEMWLDSSANILYIWDGSVWQQATADTIPIVGTSPVDVNTTDPAETVISVDGATVSSPGVVQLTNSLNSTAETLALTAAAGKNLQDQINGLVISNNLSLAGTLDSATGLLATTTPEGVAVGFIVGQPMPAADSGNREYFVIVSVPSASYTPPGGTPTETHIGDWFLSTGTSYVFLDVGYQPPYATDANPGIVQLATDAEVLNGVEETHAVTPAGLQSKLSNSISSASTLTIGSSAAVKVAYDKGAQALTVANTAQATADTAVPKASYTAKGDLVVGVANSDFTALGVGTNGQVLTADSACTSGVKWAAQAGGVTLVSGTLPVSVNNTNPATPVISVNPGTVSDAGVVQLNNTVTSTSTTQAATANAAKLAYDAGVTGQNNAAAAQLTANTAQANANTAVSTANAAQADADQALLDAAAAQLAADNAQADATLAISNAGAAQLSANNAQATADQAVLDAAAAAADAAAAQLDATQALADAATALSDASNAQLDATQALADAAGAQTTANAAIPCSVIIAKGDLIAGTALSAPAVLPIGANGQVLTADSTCTTGLKWAAGGGGGGSPATPTVAGTVLGCTTSLCTMLGPNSGVVSADCGVSIGIDALAGSTLGDRSVGIGYLAGTNIQGDDNVAIGNEALSFADPETTFNGYRVAIGSYAGLESCSNSISIGLQSGYRSGTANISIGGNAGFSNLGDYNISIGARSGCLSSAASQQNIAIGLDSGYNLNGCYNVSIGRSAHINPASAGIGCYNISIGDCSGSNICNGCFNVVIGNSTNLPVTSGSCQLVIGACPTFCWLTGCNDKSLQPQAGIRDCTGSLGTAGQTLTSTGANKLLWASPSGGAATTLVSGTLVGYTDSSVPTTGTGNTALGWYALGSSGTPGTNVDRNIGIGVCAGAALATAVENVFIGGCAAWCVATSSCNTYVGYLAGAGTSAACTGANQNVAVGNRALSGVNFNGFCSVGIGFCAGIAATGAGGTCSVIIGALAGCCGTTAWANTIIGAGAWGPTTGLNNIIIGRNNQANLTTGCGNISIGAINQLGTYASPYTFVGAECNRVVLGSTATTNAYIQVAWTVTSDERDKIVEGPVPHGLDFVEQLEPKTFHFREERGSDVPNGPKRYGFLAQEVLALEGDDPVIIDTEEAERLKYKGEALVPVLVNAIKELSAEVKALRSEVDTLKGN